MPISIDKAFEAAALAFGGVDIIVNNAGISISKSIDDHSEKDWDKLYRYFSKRTIPGYENRCEDHAKASIRWRYHQYCF